MPPHHQVFTITHYQPSHYHHHHHHRSTIFPQSSLTITHDHQSHHHHHHPHCSIIAPTTIYHYHRSHHHCCSLSPSIITHHHHYQHPPLTITAASQSSLRQSSLSLLTIEVTIPSLTISLIAPPTVTITNHTITSVTSTISQSSPSRLTIPITIPIPITSLHDLSSPTFTITVSIPSSRLTIPISSIPHHHHRHAPPGTNLSCPTNSDSLNSLFAHNFWLWNKYCVSSFPPHRVFHTQAESKMSMWNFFFFHHFFFSGRKYFGLTRFAVDYYYYYYLLFASTAREYAVVRCARVVLRGKAIVEGKSGRGFVLRWRGKRVD